MTRIDKYLWAVRLAKTRSLAANLVKTNKILVNYEPVKPSREIIIGDVISVKRNTALFSYKVLDLLERRVGAKLVADYIQDITPEEEIEKFKTYQIAQKEYRQFGLGRPTKKQRRDLGKFKGMSGLKGLNQ